MEVVVSPALIAEMTNVLGRPKFARRLRAEVDVYVEGFRKLSRMAPDPGGMTGVRLEG